MEQAVISGIAFNRDEAKITRDQRARHGRASPSRSSGPVAEANIDVDMIIQNAATRGMTDFSFTVHRNEYEKALGVLQTRR